MNAIEQLTPRSPETSGQTASPPRANLGTIEARAHEGGWRSSKAGPRHLQRQAIVYVRQSTPHQVEMSEKTLKDWVRRGWVQAIERPFGGVWILHVDEQELPRLEERAKLSRPGCHYPEEL